MSTDVLVSFWVCVASIDVLASRAVVVGVMSSVVFGMRDTVGICVEGERLSLKVRPELDVACTVVLSAEDIKDDAWIPVIKDVDMTKGLLV